MAQSPCLFADELYPAEWRCAPINESYVRRFLELAARHNIPVFWLVPPFSSEVHAKRQGRGLDAMYTVYVRSLQARFPGLTVIDGRQSGYDATVHVDPLHLDCEGASAFSADVANVVARCLEGRTGSPRWFDLAAFRSRPIAPDVEDSERSRLAVLTGDSRPRR
jgi:hypothetical protein